MSGADPELPPHIVAEINQLKAQAAFHGDLAERVAAAAEADDGLTPDEFFGSDE